MQFIPWQQISDWRCVSCGNCCKEYSVVIDFREWLGIVKTYGVEFTASTLSKFFVKREKDGSCAFLNNGSRTCSCGLQHMKPRACQLWPFKVCSGPVYGFQNEALYLYRDKPVFIYADHNCRGLTFGRPTAEFFNLKLAEFVEIAAGIRSRQLRTTGSPWPLTFYSSYNFRARNDLF
jgi:Fe-S-cluster containining protein